MHQLFHRLAECFTLLSLEDHIEIIDRRDSLGSVQAGYVLGLEAIGGDACRGMAASILYHLIYAATAVTLGLIALRQSRLDWKAVSEAREVG